MKQQHARPLFNTLLYCWQGEIGLPLIQCNHVLSSPDSSN